MLSALPQPVAQNCPEAWCSPEHIPPGRITDEEAEFIRTADRRRVLFVNCPHRPLPPGAVVHGVIYQEEVLVPVSAPEYPVLEGGASGLPVLPVAGSEPAQHPAQHLLMQQQQQLQLGGLGAPQLQPPEAAQGEAPQGEESMDQAEDSAAAGEDDTAAGEGVEEEEGDAEMVVDGEEGGEGEVAAADEAPEGGEADGI